MLRFLVKLGLVLWALLFGRRWRIRSRSALDWDRAARGAWSRVMGSPCSSARAGGADGGPEDRAVEELLADDSRFLSDLELMNRESMAELRASFAAQRRVGSGMGLAVLDDAAVPCPRCGASLVKLSEEVDRSTGLPEWYKYRCVAPGCGRVWVDRFGDGLEEVKGGG